MSAAASTPAAVTSAQKWLSGEVEDAMVRDEQLEPEPKIPLVLPTPKQTPKQTPSPPNRLSKSLSVASFAGKIKNYVDQEDWGEPDLKPTTSPGVRESVRLRAIPLVMDPAHVRAQLSWARKDKFDEVVGVAGNKQVTFEQLMDIFDD